MTVVEHSPWQRPFAPARCDVAVVGGGIIGASTARALTAQWPELSVVLLECGELAAGASGRNAGFLIPGPPGDPATAVDRYGEAVVAAVLRMTLENFELIRSLGGEHFDLELRGCLLAAGSELEAERLLRSAEVLDRFSLACEYLDAPAVSERSGLRGFEGGLFIGWGGTLDPARLVRHVARESGATIVDHWPVTAIETVGDGVRLVGPRGGMVADRAVLCLNAYLPQLVEELGNVVRPVRAQMLATAPMERFLDFPIYSHEGYFYVRQAADGRVLLGGARHMFSDEEVGYDLATTTGLQSALESYLRTHFPAIGGVTVERRWAGIMGFSGTGLPVVGRVPGQASVSFACGFTGHGMAYGLRFGELMAATAMETDDALSELFALPAQAMPESHHEGPQVR